MQNTAQIRSSFIYGFCLKYIFYLINKKTLFPCYQIRNQISELIQGLLRRNIFGHEDEKKLDLFQ